MLTLILPLVTYPYLIKVLGAKNYGLVMWAWSIINFFIIFINFGFDLYVTKYISIYRKDRTKLSKIVSTTLAAKVIFFIFSCFIFLFLILFVPEINLNKKLFFYTFLLTIGEVLMPIWYFQGIEQMKYTALITSFIKIFFTILVFLVIIKPSDYLKVPILYSIASILSALFAYYIIFFKHHISLVKPQIKNIVFYITGSMPLFLSNSISTLKDSLIIIFIERYIGLSAVAYYDIIQKFINIIITPFHIIATVVYPHIAKTKNFVLLKKVIKYTTIIIIAIYIMIYLLDTDIVNFLFGRENKVVEYVLDIISLSIVFANIASLLGINGLVVMGKNKQLFLSSIYGFVFFIFMLCGLILFNIVSLKTVAITIVIAHMVDVLFRGYFIRNIIWPK
jgi:PST family polysaccharide transporter